jgi:hypothetical protein
VATDREDVANDNEGPDSACADDTRRERQPRLRRGPVELRLPTREQLPAERLDAAYRILVRFVAQQVRQARREEAVNDQHAASAPHPPPGEDAA